MIKCIKRYNLHTHSFYCGHGSGTIAEYASEAKRLNLSLLGFSEHCPRPDGRFKRSRMPFEEMLNYEADCKREKERGGLTILTGYECDYKREHYSYYKELLENGRVNYLISGTHFIFTKKGRIVSPFTDTLDEDDVLTYRDMVLEAIDSKLFSFIAHPDLFLAGFDENNPLSTLVSHELCKAAKRENIPLEVNGNGFLKPMFKGRIPYPVPLFWRIAKEEGNAIIYNTDAHKIEALGKTREALESFISDNELDLVYPTVNNDKLSFVKMEDQK